MKGLHLCFIHLLALTQFLLIPILIANLMSCESDTDKHLRSTSVFSTKGKATKASLLADSISVKTWIKKVVTASINSDDKTTAFKRLEVELTDEYFQFKQDAMQ